MVSPLKKLNLYSIIEKSIIYKYANYVTAGQDVSYSQVAWWTTMASKIDVMSQNHACMYMF